MSTPAGSRIREGIWEIGDYEIIAHYPEGDWRLTSLDIETIRLEHAMDDGQPVCDAFIRARSQPRSDLMGRYPAGDDAFCVELALYAARNRIQLIGEPLSRTAQQATPRAAGNTPVLSPARMPKAPDSAFETQAAPEESINGNTHTGRQEGVPPYGTGQPFRSNPAADPSQAYSPNQSHDPNQGYNPNQSHDPNQGYNPNQSHDPNQSCNPNQYSNPNQYANPNQAFDPTHFDDQNQSYGFGQGYDPRQGYQQPGGFDPRFSGNFRSPEWWRWTYDRTNPAFRRNLVLTILAASVLLGILTSAIVSGAPILSGPGLIFLIIILSNRKKGKRRR